MFDMHYKLEAPKGLTEEQLEFWNEHFVPAFKNVVAFEVERGTRGPQYMVLNFDPTFNVATYAAGHWFVTKLLMDPTTKETGPLWNKLQSYPKLITAAGAWYFTVAVVDKNRFEFLLYSTG